MARNLRGNGSDPRISGKTSAAIDAILNGEAKTLTEAAAQVGMHRVALGRALKRPHVARAIEQRVRQRVKTIGLLKAAATLQNLADAAQSEYVRADVAKHLMACAGVRPEPERLQGAEGPGLRVRITLSTGELIEIGTRSPAIEPEAAPLQAPTEAGPA